MVARDCPKGLKSSNSVSKVEDSALFQGQKSASSPVNGQWVEEAGGLTVHPMDAVYLKVKNGTEAQAEMFPYEDLSIAYEKELQSGWNLFGPSLDLVSPEGYKMLGADYLNSLDGRYSLVISQPVGSQKGWVSVQRRSSVLFSSVLTRKPTWLHRQQGVLSVPHNNSNTDS